MTGPIHIRLPVDVSEHGLTPDEWRRYAAFILSMTDWAWETLHELGMFIEPPTDKMIAESQRLYENGVRAAFEALWLAYDLERGDDVRD